MKAPLLSLLLFLVLPGCKEPSNANAPAQGVPIRGLALEPLNRAGGGGAGAMPLFEIEQLYQGRVSVVNFWASWCVPCRAEHPLLMALAQAKNGSGDRRRGRGSSSADRSGGGDGRGYRLFGIAYRDKHENAARFLRSLGNPFDFVGVDSSGYAALGWGLRGVPETFVVNGEGKIVFHHQGPLTDLTAIKKAIAEAQ